MYCELCGKETGNLKKVIIEYSALRVCPECAKFGKLVPETTALAKDRKPSERLSLNAKRWTEKDVLEEAERKALVLDYPEKVKRARLSKGWTPEQLGKLLNEKKSIITKLEAGALIPDEKLTSKLEKNLNIKLMEAVKKVKVKKKKVSPTVLGDVIKIK